MKRIFPILLISVFTLCAISQANDFQGTPYMSEATTLQHEAALEKLGQAIEKDGHDPYTVYGMAFSEMELGRFDKAMDLYSRAMDGLPENSFIAIEAMIGQGVALYRTGKHAQAVNVLTKALKSNPDEARIHYMRGCAYKEMGFAAKAAEDFAYAKQTLECLDTARAQLSLEHTS